MYITHYTELQQLWKQNEMILHTRRQLQCVSVRT